MIQLKNAVKIYGQGTAQTRALNGVNFQVARGEFVAQVSQEVYQLCFSGFCVDGRLYDTREY